MSNINNNSQIDFGLLPKNIPSLCIPRVFPNISEARIRKTFEDIFIGRIEKIDIIKGDKFNRVFVHLSWNNTPDALYVRNQVMTGKDVKVVYDGPWYWMISASRNQSPQPPQPNLSHKTDEFGRELRTTMQEPQQPLIKPILQRQHACFQPPPPPTPPPMQMQRQDHRPPQPPLPPTPPPNYHHYHHQQPPQQRQQPIQRQQEQRSKQPMKRDHHQEQKQQQLTDEFGRDIRRPQPPPPQQQQQPSSHRPCPCPVSEKQKQKSWSSYDHDDEDDDEAELHKPVFIPQSPTTTPPSLRRKQIQVQEEVHIIEEEVHIIEEEVHIIEEEVHIIEEEDVVVVPSLTRSSDVDHPRQADMVQVKYDQVLPLKKIRTNNKKSKK